MARSLPGRLALIWMCCHPLWLQGGHLVRGYRQKGSVLCICEKGMDGSQAVAQEVPENGRDWDASSCSVEEQMG